MFGCCRKPFVNQVCKVCSNVFHPSCGERKKGLMVINESQVICSDECKKKHEKEIKTIETLQKKIYTLKKGAEHATKKFRRS